MSISIAHPIVWDSIDNHNHNISHYLQEFVDNDIDDSDICKIHFMFHLPSIVTNHTTLDMVSYKLYAIKIPKYLNSYKDINSHFRPPII